MSWSTLPPELRELAERVCTERELEALRLWDAGYGYGRLGLVLGISRSAARERVRNALAKLERAEGGDA